MQKIPEWTILHVVIKKEITMRRKWVTMQANKVSVPDASNCLQFSLKLTQAVRMSVQSLDSNWSGIFQNTFIYSAGSTMSYYEFLTQVLCNPHNVIICMDCHIHVENHKFGRT